MCACVCVTTCSASAFSSSARRYLDSGEADSTTALTQLSCCSSSTRDRFCFRERLNTGSQSERSSQRRLGSEPTSHLPSQRALHRPLHRRHQLSQTCTRDGSEVTQVREHRPEVRHTLLGVKWDCDSVLPSPSRCWILDRY